MRRAAKRDNNEREIFDCLKQCKVSVFQLDEPFDAVINFRNRTYLAEIKDPKKKGWASEFTDKQKQFFEKFPGWNVVVLRSREDVIDFIKDGWRQT